MYCRAYLLILCMKVLQTIYNLFTIYDIAAHMHTIDRMGGLVNGTKATVLKYADDQANCQYRRQQNNMFCYDII